MGLLDDLRTWLLWSLAMSWDSLRLIIFYLLGREYYFFGRALKRLTSFLICLLCRPIARLDYRATGSSVRQLTV